MRITRGRVVLVFGPMSDLWSTPDALNFSHDSSPQWTAGRPRLSEPLERCD